MFYDPGHKKEYSTCMEALSWKFEKPQLVAVVGAGGKTTIIHMLARELSALGYHSVGRCVKEVSHRVADVEAFLQKKGEDLVTVKDLKAISFHKQGLLKQVKSPYRIIWNRWNHEEIEWDREESLILCEEK